MPNWLLGWFLLATVLTALGAVLGAARTALRRYVESRDVTRGAFAGLATMIPLGIGGLFGNVDPWPIVTWSAAPCALAFIVLIHRAIRPEADRRKTAALAAGGAVLAALIELILVVDVLMVHALYAVAGLSLALPLAVLAERASVRGSWPAWVAPRPIDSPRNALVLSRRSNWPSWLRPWTIPATGAAIGALIAFELALEGPHAVAIGLRLWPLALGAAATVMPFVLTRVQRTWGLIRMLPRRDPRSLLRVWRHLAQTAGGLTPIRMFVASLLGVGLGALVAPATWGLGLGLVAAAALESARLRPALRTRERLKRETTLLRGVMHLAMFVTALFLAARLITVTDPTSPIGIAVIVYAASSVLTFGISAVYHRYPWSSGGADAMGRIDHSAIFVLIAGTLVAVAPGTTLGRVLVWVVAGGALVGICIKLAWPKAPAWLSLALYLTLGWSALLLLPTMPFTAALLILIGGVFVTAGAFVYHRKWPNPWPAVFGYHEIFHATTLVAAWMNFIAIWFYLLPLRT